MLATSRLDSLLVPADSARKGPHFFTDDIFLIRTFFETAESSVTAFQQRHQSGRDDPGERITMAIRHEEITKLWHAHASALTLLARTRCNAAEDCVQEAYVKLAKLEGFPANRLLGSAK